jgi:hypothetical protein
MDELAGQLGAHLGQQAAATQLQVEFSAKVLEELRARKGSNISIQQIAQILVANNVANTPENIQHALGYLQEGSTATSSAGVAGPPPQPKAPLQPMGIGGMSKKEEEASSAPLLRMDPMGLPIGHIIHDEGFIAGATLATPKIVAAKTIKRMPLKYHRTWGTLATAVMKRKITAEEAIERLRRLRKQQIKKTQPLLAEQHEPTDEETMAPVSKRTKSPEADGGGKRVKNKSRSPSIINPDAPPPPPLWYPRPPPGNPPRPPSHPPPRSRSPLYPRNTGASSSTARPTRAPSVVPPKAPQPSQRPPRPTRAPSVGPRGRSQNKSPPPP